MSTYHVWFPRSALRNRLTFSVDFSHPRWDEEVPHCPLFSTAARKGLNEWIKLFKNTLKGYQTLFIIDDCSAEDEINKKRDALSELAFSGQHRNHSLWVLTQKYNFVSKDVTEQIKWLCLFFTKDWDSFEDCLR